MTSALEVNCPPLYGTRRSPDRPTLGPQVSRLAESLGKPPLPHQRLIYDVAFEIDPATGMLAYDEVTVIGPRQVTGKTELMLPAMTYRCVAFDEALVRWVRKELGKTVPLPGPQRVLYTAQTADNAREKWRDVHVNRLERSPIRSQVKTRLRLNAEQIAFPNGSTWSPGSTTGKALDLDTPLWTQRGWVPMADIREGDTVPHPGGHMVTVVGTSPVMTNHDCYRVTTSDGRVVIADGEHLWTVRDTRLRRTRSDWVTMTTGEMRASGLRTSRAGNRFHLPPQRAVKTPDVELPIDPYVFGVWLGDGSKREAAITAGQADVDHVRAQIREAGYLVTGEYQDKRTGVWRIRFNCVKPVLSCSTAECARPVRRHGMCDTCSARARRHGTTPDTWQTRNGMETRLRRLGVLGDKSVPEAYLTAGTDQRLALLQGLMDTDGCIVERDGSSPRCEFTSTSHALADAVLFLARSLGWRTTMLEGRATLNGRDCGPKWRVGFLATADDSSPFRLARKASKIRPAMPNSGRRVTVSIVAIEPVESRPVRCIKVDSPDGLFLAGRGLIPTHNTAGTGDTLDMPVIDEAWSQQTNRTELGLRPAMLTRPWRQLWALSMIPGISRALPGSWPYLWSKRQNGRARVEADIRSRVAYFEWAAPKDSDPADPATWFSCMPALGHHVPLSSVQSDYDSMAGAGNLTDFTAEYLGWPPEANAARWATISEQTWKSLQLPRIDGIPYGDPVAFGVEAQPEQVSASIGMSARTPDGHTFVELVEQRPGLNWTIDVLAELIRKFCPCAVGIAAHGPAAPIIEPLRRKLRDDNLDTEIVVLQGPEVTKACGQFYTETGEVGDHAEDTGRRIRHLGQRELDQSVADSIKYKYADQWRFQRSGEAGDASPLYSVVLARAAGEAVEWLGGSYDIGDSLG